MITVYCKNKTVQFVVDLIALIVFFECISTLNNQLVEDDFFWPYPLDFILDLQEGFWGFTTLNILITSSLYVLTYGWYQGGLSRILAQHVGLFIASLRIILVGTMAIFNAWMHSHLMTLKQFTEVVSDISPHTKAYTRLWGSFVLASIIPVFFILSRVYEKIRQDNKALGHAHFSTGLETYRAGFFKHEEQSLIIGKKHGVPLFSNGFEHVLVFAPSGSGKSRSIAIPNLFHYPYSVICNDVKFTLYETTSGYRHKVLGHECYCFAPTRTDGRTHRYNPLAVISKNPLERITHIQQIAHIFIPDNPKESPIWTAGSRKLFKTLILFLLDSEDYPTTFGAMNRLVKQEQFDFWLKEVLDTTEHFDPEFYRNGYSYLNNAEKTRQGIVETFSSYFELFDDPFIDAATSGSDFDFSELRRKKITIYMGFSDDEMTRLAPLLTLIWQQVISCMIKELPDPVKDPYPILCLIDEFSSLGRIERLRSSLKLLREYRVRCILMFQYIAQTYEKYSHDEAKAFINIKTKVAYITEDINDAEFISKMLGTRTKKVVSYSVNQQHQGISEGKSVSYQAIPLMRPDELMRMSPKIALIIRSNNAPIKAKQWIWYHESMQFWVKPKTIVPQQQAKQIPFIRKSQDEEIGILDFID